MQEEEFRPIPGYEDEYSISKSGRIVSNKFPGREKKPTVNKNGQVVVVLFKNSSPKHFTINRLVEMAFGLSAVDSWTAKMSLKHNRDSFGDRNVARMSKPIYVNELHKHFSSIKEAAAYLRIDYDKLRKALKNSDEFKGYHFWLK